MEIGMFLVGIVVGLALILIARQILMDYDPSEPTCGRCGLPCKTVVVLDQTKYFIHINYGKKTVCVLQCESGRR